jgi:1,2-alpha-glucosylglycerol phosphorylase
MSCFSLKINDRYYTTTGWDICEKTFTPEHLISRGSNFLTGNGYLGYRGTFPDWRRDQYVGCFVSGTYDNADGKWTELSNAPNALYTNLEVNGKSLPLSTNPPAPFKHKYYSRLNLQNGLLEMQNYCKTEEGAALEIRAERFASYDDLHIIPMRFQVKALSALELTVSTGIDGNVWDLNGIHIPDLQLQAHLNFISAKGRTVQSGLTLVVYEGHSISGVEPQQAETVSQGQTALRKYTFSLKPGDEIMIDKLMTVCSSFDGNNPEATAFKSLEQALDKGYECLLEEHQPHWNKIWKNIDIKITGDLFSQALLRFNLYHAIICAPLHSDSLPIGARGLSCQAYQGAAFWDQEIYNLPMLTWTMPDAARRILTYRYKTLGGALRKAKALGYSGAFYAWVSGMTGDELCPSFFFEDVLTGRKIRNHFNDWQIHISPDIVYAIWQYYQVTGDWSFIEEYGAEIIFEVARFLHSHAFYKKDRDRFELIRLLGPDEYHENVDNNAYTNYLAKFSLRTALVIEEKLKKEMPSSHEQLSEKLKLTETDFANWREMAAKIYLPQPDPSTGLIEQFDGYFTLEDTTPADLQKRLLDKNEYWGWPNGVAVHTQVTKQADVLQLFVLNNCFSLNTLEANYRYYEPRCQHGSSLSASVHAIIAARTGRIEEAFNYFKHSCLVDLSATAKAESGGTFIGGIHTAACGAAWQIVMLGFLGMEYNKGRLTFKPNLPEAWQEVTFKLCIGGRQKAFKATRTGVEELNQ